MKRDQVERYLTIGDVLVLLAGGGMGAVLAIALGWGAHAIHDSGHNPFLPAASAAEGGAA